MLAWMLWMANLANTSQLQKHLSTAPLGKSSSITQIISNLLLMARWADRLEGYHWTFPASHIPLAKALLKPAVTYKKWVCTSCTNKTDAQLNFKGVTKHFGIKRNVWKSKVSRAPFKEESDFSNGIQKLQALQWQVADSIKRQLEQMYPMSGFGEEYLFNSGGE